VGRSKCTLLERPIVSQLKLFMMLELFAVQHIRFQVFVFKFDGVFSLEFH
jgi:hypothetical protein